MKYPGVGNKLAAAIVAELSDASQFMGAKQIVASAELDPGIYSWFLCKEVISSARICKAS
ncbi:transposase [Brevibacillus reuszeri]|uniref:transposase n=1 Tax=Brevibacillus reuszeri TaxID=54915 RepID=UPI003D2378DD